MNCRALDTLIYLRLYFFMKKLSRSKLIKKYDSIFSIYIRLRDSNRDWIVVCPLCWAKIPRKKSQNMHFISRWVLKYRYDEDNCHAWCYRCNVLLHWNYISYTRWMQNKYWMERIDEMINDKTISKLATFEIEEAIAEYTIKCKQLANKKHLAL